MRVIIHEMPLAGAPPCDRWEPGDGLTAAADAVTCPQCVERQQRADACPSRSVRGGHRCAGKLGHGGLHHSDRHGVVHAWVDDRSPELAWELLQRS